MSSKLSLSIALAIALSATAGMAQAATEPRSSSAAREPAVSSTNAMIDAGETDNPHSIDYDNRVISGRSTNDQINAAETGNPDSPDYKDRPAFPADEKWRAEWEALDAGSPDKR
jgi:hypothetical protein